MTYQIEIINNSETKCCQQNLIVQSLAKGLKTNFTDRLMIEFIFTEVQVIT